MRTAQAVSRKTLYLLYKLISSKGTIKPIWTQLNGVNNKIFPIISITALLQLKSLMTWGQISKYSTKFRKPILHVDIAMMNTLVVLPGLAKSQHCKRCIPGKDLRICLYLANENLYLTNKKSVSGKNFLSSAASSGVSSSKEVNFI